MRKKDFKGKCFKQTLPKCKGICKTYDDIQTTYAIILSEREDISEIRCNVVLDNFELGNYMSDFVCTKTNGELLVRECISEHHIGKPMTVKLLDASKTYWERRSADWGLVINE